MTPIRKALFFALVTFLGGLTACAAPQADTTLQIQTVITVIAEVPVTRIVEQTVESEVTRITEVTREVLVTRIVEVITERDVVATATPTVTAAPSPVPTVSLVTPVSPLPSIRDQVLGKWSGAQTSTNGEMVPALWEFLPDGTMLVSFVGIDFKYGASWSIDGNRITIVTELEPDRSTYRDVEFLSADVMRLTKDEAAIVETWSRIN